MVDDTAFQRQVRNYYRLHGRHDLVWRHPEPDGNFDPYKILVSEIMLQQTGVTRVTPKFISFMEQFPNVTALSLASLGSVLRAWSGLGYNRRAKFLHQAARMITDHYGGTFPDEQTQLTTLPGVGPNTAGAIAAYAFNRPAVFVETNIRTVFIHHYFATQTAIGDKAILEMVARTLPRSDVRSWYWGLMDYGACLKQSIGNLNTASRSYAKQSKFVGSRRQIRGRVIRLLGEQPYTAIQLKAAIADERLQSVLAELLDEQLIQKSGQQFSL